MNILKVAFKNLLQRKIRSVLTIFGISIGIASFIALVGLANGLQGALERTYEERGADIIIFEKDKPHIITSTVAQNLINKLKYIPGVKDATGILLDLIRFGNRYIIVYGREDDSYLSKTSNIVAGRKPRGTAKEALLGDIAAKSLKKNIGDKIKIGRKKFEIVGIYSSGSIFERGSIILPLEQLQNIRSHPGKVTMINVRVKGRLDKIGNYRGVVNKVKENIAKKYPDLAVETSEEFLLGEGKALLLVRAVTWAISLVALCIVIIGTMNVMMMSVFEKTREIGILMAIGWNKFKVFQLVIFESLCLSILGGIIGVCFGYIALDRLVKSPRLHGFVDISYNATFIVEIFLIVLLVGIFSAFYPASKAMSLSPTEALRYE